MIATTETADFVSLDIGTLRNWLDRKSGCYPGPVPVSMTRFLDGSATDDDRLILANFAATKDGVYPRTCEALARELDRTVSK